jgi:2-C-methyl-D-erythritol 4-phosphate cytidylyltransferase
MILAAGEGNRFGASKPKQLLELHGRPLFAYALHQHVTSGHQTVIVVSESTKKTIMDYIARVFGNAGIVVVAGGATRRESILAGIDAIPLETPPRTGVLLRNAASPNIPTTVIDQVVRGLETVDCVQAYIPSSGTTFLHEDGRLERLYDRATTGLTVDPTGYNIELLRQIGQAMESSRDGETTLDIARSLGAEISLVESPSTNIKLTVPTDMARLRDAVSEQPLT